MGTDINFVVEHRVGPDRPWTLATRTGSSDWYEDRNYECFSLLTGLDFSPRTLRPLEPVAALRGWPADLSNSARERLVSWSQDGSFARSWLDVCDLGTYDWEADMTWTFIAAPPLGSLVTDAAKRDVKAYLEEHRHLPSGWHVSGGSSDGLRVSVGTSPRAQAGRFLDVVRDMTELAGENPHSVRCVFDFTP